MTTAYDHAMPRLLAGEALDRASAAALMTAMMSGELSHPRTAAVLTALAMRGETAEELTGFASVMRAHAHQVAYTAPAGEPLLDTCGTGGSGLDTANTSTMAAFILAAAGVRVAKHGNRSSSGRCGSMDVLELLGVHIEIGPDAAVTLLDDQGVAFLFAPLYHPAMRFVVPVRRDLGFRTAFNFLGPLCNPARATHQVLGVSDPRRADLMAQVLADLGSERVMVVHGDDGLDELTLSAPSTIWLVADGQVQVERMSPADAGLQKVELSAFQGGSPAENVAIFKRVLGGKDASAHRDHVALNAAAGLLVTGRVSTLAAGVEVAVGLLESGAAWESFESYRAATQSLLQANASTREPSKEAS